MPLNFFLWLTLPAKTLKDHWPISIAPQHSKVPVPKYPPMTKPLSNLGAGSFKGTIKVKTLTETHSEQKFGASLATWHCPPTLKSPRTKISTYDKSLVKFGSPYFQGDNQSENNDLNPFRVKVLSIFGHMALPTNTQKYQYQNTSLWQIPCQVYEPVLSMPKSKRKPSLEPIQSKSLEHLWSLGIAHQHSAIFHDI